MKHTERARVRPSGRSFPWQWLLALTVVPLLVGCHHSSDSSTTELRAIHASADAPNVDIVVNGSTVLTNVPYETASAFLSIPSGTTSIAVNPTGSSTSVLNTSASLQANHQYSAIVVGSAAASAPSDQQLQAILVDDPGNTPATGNVKVRVVHGAPGVPAVDVYVTAPGVALPDAPTIAGLAYTAMAPASGTSALEVPGGSYEIRITVAGDQTKAVVFDSGTVPLPANGDLLVTAVPASGIAPVNLLVAPAGGSAAVIADARAAVRIGHLSPNVPAVDVSVNVAQSASSVLTLPNVAFPTVSGYSVLPGGSYDASVALASNPGTPVLTLNGATLPSGSSTSVFAIGLLGGTGAQALQLAAYTDDRVPMQGMAKVRVIHLAPDAPAVDVVVLGTGGAIAETLVSNLSYPNATSSDLQVPPGSYTLAVVPTGMMSPVLPTAAGVTVTLQGGQVLTIAAVGCLNISSGPCANGAPFSFKVLSDN
ncbi:MAG: DUF4397 domain-containing protein [Proteobacteria bacterium]|nr:DUF4397 domain-containing protein [Pseudomonadota bacterium]